MTDKTDRKQNGDRDESEFRVDDRRHWASDSESDEDVPGTGEVSRPSVLDEYRERAETAERNCRAHSL